MIVVPARMGRINKRALLSRLQRMGTASRADLAKSLGLSQPTAGKIVDQLLAVGVLEEADPDQASSNTANFGHKSAPKLGRPGRLLRLNQTQPRFLGLQLGVSETSLAPLPVGTSGEDRWSVHVPTPRSASAWVRQLRKAAAGLGHKDFWGVLVSVPGIVDEKAARILFSPNLHWTEGIDLPALIRQVWHAPTFLVQEERALALGQQAVDSSGEDFLLVDLGEGAGGAVIVAGKLYAHPLPISGELGHTPVLGNRRPCGCGATGCLETLMSTRGLLEGFATAARKGPKDWPALVQSVEQNGIAPWLAKALDATAAVIAGALNVLGLRRVILTGSLSDLPRCVFEHLSDAIVKGALWGRFGKLECELAPRRRTAGLVAVGIDRLVVPMAEAERQHETLLHVAATHGAG